MGQDLGDSARNDIDMDCRLRGYLSLNGSGGANEAAGARSSEDGQRVFAKVGKTAPVIERCRLVCTGC
jgi:hypothetical protein